MIKKILFTIIISFFVLISYAQELSLQTGHSASILDLEFSHDNRYLFSAGADNKVIIWDMATMKQMRLLSGHSDKVNDIALIPAKNQIATASDDGTVRIWSYPDAELLKVYNFNKPIKAIDFSPNGENIAIASDSILIFNLKTENSTFIPIKARKMFTTVAYSKNGSFLSFGGKNENYTYVYELIYKHIVNRLKAQSNAVYFSDDNKYIYSAGNNGTLKIRPIIKKSSKRKNAFVANNFWDAYTDIVETDKYLISSNLDNLVYVFDRNSKKRIEILKGHNKDVLALAVSSDGKYLASAGKGRKIIIWNLKTFSHTNILVGGANSINSLSFSDDGNFMFLTYEDGSSRIWNLQNKGQMLFFESPQPNNIRKYYNNEYTAQNSFFNINSKKNFILNSLIKIDRKNETVKKRKNQIFIWDIQNYGNVYKINNKKTNDFIKLFVTDTNRIVEIEYKSTHSQKYSLINHEKILDRQTVYSADVNTYYFNKKLKNKKTKLKKLYKKYDFSIHGDIYYSNISPNGEFFMNFKNTKNGRICDLWDIEIADKISTIVLEKKYDYGGFSSSGNYLYIASSKDSLIKIYELSSQILIDSFKGITPFVFAENDQYCAFCDNKKQLHVYDFKNKKELFSIYTEHQSKITDIKFNLKHNFVSTVSNDGLVKLWSLENGKALVSLAAFNKDDFIYVSPDNYYYSTKGAMNYIGFILKNTLYTFDQFDVLFNRPDTVLARLDYTSNDEIDLFKRAYHKRLKKMGFSSQLVVDNYNIPVIEINNLSTIPITTEDSTLNLIISATDSIYNLDRINIWINGVPLYGTPGFSVKSKKIKQFKDNFDIVLNSGKNKIDVAAYNSQGAQSLKKSFNISYNSKNVHDLYLVVVGISDYKDDANELAYAAKDANDIVMLFEQSKTYNNVYVTKILNKDATRNNILAVKNKLQKTNVDDEVVLFYAGHGFLDEEFNYYLTCYDFDYIDFFTSTVEYDEFIAVLDSIPARNKLVLIDACHSGEVDTDAKSDRNTKVVNVNETLRGENDRSLWTREFGDMPKLGSQSSFELMKIIFADLRIGSGATIISSAGGQEYAYESDKIKNGVFTYVLLNGLKSKDADLNKDGVIMLSELQDYVMKTVSSLTKGRQNPTNRRQNLESDFIIWK